MICLFRQVREHQKIWLEIGICLKINIFSMRIGAVTISRMTLQRIKRLDSCSSWGSRTVGLLILRSVIFLDVIAPKNQQFEQVK